MITNHTKCAARRVSPAPRARADRAPPHTHPRPSLAPLPHEKRARARGGAAFARSALEEAARGGDDPPSGDEGSRAEEGERHGHLSDAELRTRPIPATATATVVGLDLD